MNGGGEMIIMKMTLHSSLTALAASAPFGFRKQSNGLDGFLSSELAAAAAAVRKWPIVFQTQPPWR